MNTAAPDLSSFTVGDLLRLGDATVAELRRRRLVRTGNKPLGDIAEQVVLKARGGELGANSAVSYDITTPDGQRIQVKSMGVRAAGDAGMFSAFRSFGFDTAVFVVFDGEWELAEAWELTASTVAEVARYRAHTNGHVTNLRVVRSAGGDNVTAEMGAAWRALDAS